MAQDALDKISEAYAQAAREQPKAYPALPAWIDLSLEMKEAFIGVFHAGYRYRSDELEAEREATFKRYEM